MAEFPRYKYKQLFAPNYIRLLRLLPRRNPRDRDEIIMCELFEISASDAMGRYNAISYMWGRRDANRDILIRTADSSDSGYSSLHITENLWTCLRKLRHDTIESNNGSALWIDAICINQANDAERNSQVAQMGNIYSGAKKVIIWPALGANSSKTLLLLEFLCKIEEDQPGDVPFDTHLLNYYQDEEYVDMWDRLGDFCISEYWSRVWIVQETVLARTLTIHCENEDVPRASSVAQRGLEWNTFVRICNGLANLPVDWPLLDSVSLIRNSIPLRIASLRTSGKYGSLRDLLTRFEDSRCTEARDRIYGLLSLDPFGAKLNYTVDYSSTMFEVFASVVQIENSSRDNNAFSTFSFSQLLQRSLGGPFTTSISPSETKDERGPDIAQLLCIGGILVDQISPVEPVWNKSTNTARIRRKRLDALKALFQSPVNSEDDYHRYLASCLSQLEGVPPLCFSRLRSSCSFASENRSSRFLESNPQPFESQHHHSDCNHRLFLSANGLLGVGPGCIREDDVICGFTESDVSAVLRPISNGGTYQIIGRAVICKEFSEKDTESRLHELSPHLFKFRVPSIINSSRIVFLHVDVITLQTLTCAY